MSPWALMRTVTSSAYAVSLTDRQPAEMEADGRTTMACCHAVLMTPITCQVQVSNWNGSQTVCISRTKQWGLNSSTMTLQWNNLSQISEVAPKSFGKLNEAALRPRHAASYPEASVASPDPKLCPEPGTALSFMGAKAHTIPLFFKDFLEVTLLDFLKGLWLDLLKGSWLESSQESWLQVFLESCLLFKESVQASLDRCSPGR
ncbi:uncharacterized protein LOC112548236 [Alligator sinensis]|uniref:Uncharacterized protein LOC112548236 n=1 Tax=Alligator sinensis TaxID=38654 RepID=A0A3Q0FTR8_ALLSI|nr:uncharacterized protein LOC112548236 [Alligator sinensis]